MSPSKKLLHAKKLITSTNGFKLDMKFNGPINGRSLGGKIYNGPGKNHDVLGKVQKDGVVSIVGRTEDRIWLSVKCGDNFEGWVLASEVDLNCDRKIYQHHDTIQKEIDPSKIPEHERIMYVLRDAVIRSKPKWSAHAIMQVIVNTKLTFTGFDESKEWTQVSIDNRNNPLAQEKTLITGWIPADQLSNVPV